MGELGLNFEPTGLRKQLVQHEYLFLAFLGALIPSMLIYILSLCRQSMKEGFPNLVWDGCFKAGLIGSLIHLLPLRLMYENKYFQ